MDTPTGKASGDSLAGSNPYCDDLPGLKRAWLAGPRGRIYYETEGRGPLLVLQSGGPGGTHQCFHPGFSRAASFATVVYHDPIGVGRSDRPGPAADGTSPYGLGLLVEEIEELRLALGGGKIVVLGHSFGGLLAQLYALAHPGSLAGLVLVSSSTGLPGTRKSKARLDARMDAAEVLAVRDILRGERDGTEGREYRAFLAGAWKRHFLHEPCADYKAHRRFEWDPDPRFVAAIDAEARNVDLSGAFPPGSALAPPALPTLIVDSHEDLVFCEGKVEELAANHPGARLLPCEGSGHYPFIEEADRFFAGLEGFMAGLA